MSKICAAVTSSRIFHACCRSCFMKFAVSNPTGLPHRPCDFRIHMFNHPSMDWFSWENWNRKASYPENRRGFRLRFSQENQFIFHPGKGWFPASLASTSMPSALGLLVLAKRGPMLGDAMTGATRHACRAMIYSSQPLKEEKTWENYQNFSRILIFMHFFGGCYSG